MTFEVFKRPRSGTPSLTGWSIGGGSYHMMLTLGSGPSRLSGLRRGDLVVMLWDRKAGMVGSQKVKADEDGWKVGETPQGNLRIKCSQFLRLLPLGELPCRLEYEAFGYDGQPVPGFRVRKS